jgi:hypothetical protein
MGLKAYELRAEFKDTYVGGQLAYGPDSHSFDVAEALEKGEGRIVTDDEMLQTALESLDGGDGPLLKHVAVGDNPVITPLPGGATGVVQPGVEPSLSEQATELAENAPGDVQPVETDAALHLPTASEWEQLDKDALIEEIERRNAERPDENQLEWRKSWDKPKLAQVLEADDNTPEVSA